MRSMSAVFMLATGLLGACADHPTIAEELDPPPPPAGAVLIECHVDVSAAHMRCAPPTPGLGGVSADLILGGQGTYVLLWNGAITIDGNDFSTPVTVVNYTAQAMGTPDGTTVSPRGVRVFFASGPTNGVEVANADGEEMYTGPDQPYFQYDGILEPYESTDERTWSFALNGATSFSFSVYVVAEVPSETGMLLVYYVGEWLLDVWGEGSTVVAVGTWGTIVRSTDGGATWGSANAEASFDFLLGIWGEGSTLVAVGGHVPGTRFRGLVVRSTDGGATWAEVSTDTNLLEDVWGEGSTVIAVGSEGGIVRSTDGGATWASVPSGTTA
jgi:hypothetical protein